MADKDSARAKVVQALAILESVLREDEEQDRADQLFPILHDIRDIYKVELTEVFKRASQTKWRQTYYNKTKQ